MFKKSVVKYSAVYKLLQWAVTGLCLLFLIFISVIFIKNTITAAQGIAPIWSDEYFYLMNAKATYSNRLFIPSFTFNGYGAAIGGGDVHGFMYSLIIAFFSFFIGWNFKYIIFLNILYVLVAILIVILNKKIPWTFKCIIWCIIGSSIVLNTYVFSFMQESIHLLFAVIIAFLFQQFYNNLNRKNIVCIIAVTIVAALFKPSWLFIFVGFIPYLKKQHRIFAAIIIVLLLFIFSFLIVYYFYEPYPNFMSKILERINHGDLQLAFILFFQHFFDNIQAFITHNSSNSLDYMINKFSIFFLMIVFLISFLKLKKKEVASICLMISFQFFFLLFFYDCFAWREIRFWFPNVVMAIVWLAFQPYKELLSILFIIMLPFSFSTVQRADEWLEQRQQQYKFYTTKKDEMKVFAEIANYTNDTSDIPIVEIRDFQIDYNYQLLMLPVKNNVNKPIIYKFSDGSSEYNNIVADFLLFPSQNPDNANLYHWLSTPYYHLYKRRKV